MKIGVMQGSLQDFDLPSVLQVVGLGRQYTGVDVRLENGLQGTVFVKSGKVVSVQANDSSGVEALARLVGFGRGSFSVFRSETPPSLPQPIGPLRQLLVDAQKRASAAERTPTSKPSPLYADGAGDAAADANSTEQMRPGAEPSGLPAGHAVLAVASPKGGCGKSTIALNLALALARRGTRVILIDADVNSDILSVLDARGKARKGSFDVILRGASLEQALLETALTNLSIVPAVGADGVDFDALDRDHGAGWKALLEEASERAQVVVVDTPAGMVGITRQVLQGCSHVLGVLQAESVAQRSFERFHQALARLSGHRVEVLGVVLNMLQMRHAGSFSVFQEACREQLGQWLFDTTIPRHPAFLDAALEGVPLRPLDEQAPGAVGFLFDNLASEVAERLALPVAPRTRKSLLL